MAAYKVNHRYSSRRDGVSYGPYEPGTVVDLDESDAEWVNRDSPGTLSAVTEAPAEPRRQAPASPNRQHKGGRNRAGA